MPQGKAVGLPPLSPQSLGIQGQGGGAGASGGANPMMQALQTGYQNMMKAVTQVYKQTQVDRHQDRTAIGSGIMDIANSFARRAERKEAQADQVAGQKEVIQFQESLSKDRADENARRGMETEKYIHLGKQATDREDSLNDDLNMLTESIEYFMEDDRWLRNGISAEEMTELLAGVTQARIAKENFSSLDTISQVLPQYLDIQHRIMSGEEGYDPTRDGLPVALAPDHVTPPGRKALPPESLVTLKMGGGYPWGGRHALSQDDPLRDIDPAWSPNTLTMVKMDDMKSKVLHSKAAKRDYAMAEARKLTKTFEKLEPIMQHMHNEHQIANVRAYQAIQDGMGMVMSDPERVLGASDPGEAMFLSIIESYYGPEVVPLVKDFVAGDFEFQTGEQLMGLISLSAMADAIDHHLMGVSIPTTPANKEALAGYVSYLRENFTPEEAARYLGPEFIRGTGKGRWGKTEMSDEVIYPMLAQKMAKGARAKFKRFIMALDAQSPMRAIQEESRTATQLKDLWLIKDIANQSRESLPPPSVTPEMFEGEAQSKTPEELALQEEQRSFSLLDALGVMIRNKGTMAGGDFLEPSIWAAEGADFLRKEMTGPLPSPEAILGIEEVSPAWKSLSATAANAREFLDDSGMFWARTGFRAAKKRRARENATQRRPGPAPSEEEEDQGGIGFRLQHDRLGAPPPSQRSSRERGMVR